MIYKYYCARTLRRYFMEKFRLRMEYKADGKIFITNLLETEHFTMDVKNAVDHIKLVINPKTQITVDDLTVTFPVDITADSRIFANGYQSWTDCREYFTNESQSAIVHKYNVLAHKTRIGASGDYGFTKYSSDAGVFQGYSYAYIRNDKTFDLIGSIDERTGFTFITVDSNKKEVSAKKDLEGVILDHPYAVMDIIEFKGGDDEVFDKYFAVMGIEKPRVKKSTGYTTWYNYYAKVNQKIVEDDLEAMSGLNLDIDFFQIDDGYQTAVGDWLSIISEKFPDGMKHCADEIHAKGMKAGLWLAPLGAQFNSHIRKEHPDWIIKDKKGKQVLAGINWGTFYALDIENQECADYIRHCFDVILNEWGFDMVKLDFLYSACIIPRNGKSRGQLMCEAMDFIRDCVGDKLILGCGVPLWPSFGKVDFCRIGADMGLKWKDFHYIREFVSTEYTLANSIFRRQLDNRAFCNDPDVFLLRDNNIKLNEEQKKIIATVNNVFGSLLFVSDNVSANTPEQMDLFKWAVSKSDIKVKSAEFIKQDVIRVDYTDDGADKSLTFDIKNGILA